MYKVVKHSPSRTVSATTSEAVFDKITQPGSSEEDVKGGFVTKDEAQDFANNMSKNNPTSGLTYSVREE